MDTVVADTCALVSLAIPKADSNYDTVADPDLLQSLLTGCRVTIPTQVESELREMAQYEDARGAAATNVLAASRHYSTVDPLDLENAPDNLPDHGLDDGEMAGIVLANARTVDAFLTGEFTNLARVRALLADPMVVPTPRLIRDYARNGHLSNEKARALFETIAPRRSREGNAYVESIRQSL